jgi:hypothetical protein
LAKKMVRASVLLSAAPRQFQLGRAADDMLDSVAFSGISDIARWIGRRQALSFFRELYQNGGWPEPRLRPVLLVTLK